jgi:hypothetical protein
MRAGEGSWQRETSDGSAWSSWASPVAENFLHQDDAGPRKCLRWRWPTEIFSFNYSFGTDQYTYLLPGFRVPDILPVNIPGLVRVREIALGVGVAAATGAFLDCLGCRLSASERWPPWDSWRGGQSQTNLRHLQVRVFGQHPAPSPASPVPSDRGPALGRSASRQSWSCYGCEEPPLECACDAATSAQAFQSEH